MNDLARIVREAALPLEGTPADYDPLMEMVGDAQFVLLGEATHGTHEFYQARAEMTRRLIEEKGFSAVAVEADWPDAFRVNRWVRGRGEDLDAAEALGGFKRFPQWMWRNADVLDFVGWLRAHNDSHPADNFKAGFYGLDLYSLHSSIEAVETFLDKHDPVAAEIARKRYACFDRFGRDTQNYGMAAGAGERANCEEAVRSQWLDLSKRRDEFAHNGDGDEFFFACQNAFVIKSAEQYYRNMFRSEVSSWNLRDHHMKEMLVNLADYLEEGQETARVVVWAHNSHLGNARATQMGDIGEVNLGQLLRDHFGKRAVLVGFTTHHGTVTAASDWDEMAERKTVRPGLAGSYEAIFHRTGIPRFWLEFEKHPVISARLLQPRLERAIGVIYQPATERASHYFTARLAEQFDAIIHIDETRAVEPLECSADWMADEVEETFPTGL